MNRIFKKILPGGKKACADTGNALTDYDIYIMSGKEKLLYTAAAAVVIYIVGYIFYRSHLLSLLLCPLACFYPGIKAKELVEKRKLELNIQFKDLLYSLSSSLSAGRPVESAFRDVVSDLAVLYPDLDTDIIREANYIVRRIGMNETVESALADFAGRSHVGDIENFADVFFISKRTGGNVVEVIKNTSNIINDKIEIRQEIGTILAERKFERKVLNVLPVAMIVLLSISAGDYIRPVFITTQGRVVMTVSIALLAAAWFISKKIMNIKV